MYLNTMVSTAAPVRQASLLIAPPTTQCMGSNSALSTPVFGWSVVDAGVRDAKQAAPPRGELR
jgi:hypothetical protein